MWSPVCEPPRRCSTRSVVEIARAGRPDLVVDRGCRPGGRGRCPARKSTSSMSRLPRPAIRRLVHEHRLDRRPARGRPAAQLAEAQRERVDAEAVLVGVELDGTEPARVTEVERAAVGEAHAEAQPRRVRRRSLAYSSGSPAASSSMTHPAAHAEVQRERRAVGDPCRAAGACPAGARR